MTAISVQRVNHMNVVLEDFDASVAHFGSVFDAEFMADMPQNEMHAGLFAIGRVIFELFVPHEWLLNSRYGAHYVGVEYQADIDQVRTALAERDIRIVRDIGIALHTHPADCFGVAFEFYAGYFHDREWEPLGGKMKPASFWRDDHPLGLTGLKAYTVAVRDLEGASSFMQSLFGAQVSYDEPREAIAGRARGLQVGDAALELVSPSGPGELADHLARYGDGIRSTVFGVRDIEQAKAWFEERSIPSMPGSRPGSIMLAPAANMGVLFEFTE